LSDSRLQSGWPACERPAVPPTGLLGPVCFL
jgi:hypothetical protein